MIGVIGRSGAGKSTLLRMINRMIDPTEGRIHAEGINVTALRGKDLRNWRARTAMIFQQFNLVHRLDVLTNVLCGCLHDLSGPRMLLKLFTEPQRIAAIEALDRVEISSPIVLRLDGTNAEAGREILAPHLSERLVAEPTMLDAARRAVALAGGKS